MCLAGTPRKGKKKRTLLNLRLPDLTYLTVCPTGGLLPPDPFPQRAYTKKLTLLRWRVKLTR